MWQFWVDRGGTFTDIVARTPDGALKTHKLLSENPEHYADAAIQGMRDLMALTGDAPLANANIHTVKMGTTVATNALLERKGDKTLLLITQGMGDLLKIGYQNRPKLFDLNIILPEQLYSRVAEIKERISADGKILTSLDEEHAIALLSQAFADGYRSVAVAFMHGYKFQNHEKRVGALAAEIGFEQISLSHQVSPLVKLISRGDTTVVDAYLSPILRRYVDQVGTALGADTKLMFMQSHGGLIEGHLFQGKDAILSGPAGGVVGMVKTSESLGFKRLIGFDMGGTSTDVCHYAGNYERSFETEIAGVRIRAPMMHIHTVAAGGGSILSFDNGRMQVGPASAGANPGPASYRRGGPLTVTDCNLLLGKLQPNQFPAVFGRDANQELDADIVRKKFNEMAQFIADETDASPQPIEKLAEGFVKIAAQNMANAIKKISVERGYDVTQYTLNCFGGAGGQHACLVADILGIETIFIHPFAGVLSALGMGLADLRVMRENQFEGDISKIDDAVKILHQLESETRYEILNQNISNKHISIIRTAHIRNDGSHQALPVSFGTQTEMKEAFEAMHHQRFGFVPPYEDLIIELLTVEAVGKTNQNVTISEPVKSFAKHDKTDKVYVKMHCENRWRDVPIINRKELQQGEIINGPAIIVEPTGTNIVESGWLAEMSTGGNLIMKRITSTRKSHAIATDANPIMLEVFNNLFMSIAEQMGSTLANTAFSVNIKERFDFSCAIFSPEGNLVANAPHVPVHLGSMSDSVRHILAENKGKIQPDDVFMLNNPFRGGTHLPDITVITPVFNDDGTKIIFVVASRGHHADIGGKTPGSAPPDSTHIEEEGVVIDNFLLVKQGKLREAETRALLASGKYPCRNINQNIADLNAQIAANTTGLCAR